LSIRLGWRNKRGLLSVLRPGQTLSGLGDIVDKLTLSVNGATQVVSVAPEMALLFVLRNELKLTGPRMGCGMAQCGACAVPAEAKRTQDPGSHTEHGAPVKKPQDAPLKSKGSGTRLNSAQRVGRPRNFFGEPGLGTGTAGGAWVCHLPQRLGLPAGESG